MKKYLTVLVLLLAGCLLIIIGLSLTESDAIHTAANSEGWCDAMVEKPNSQWSKPEAVRFSKQCLYE